MLRTRTLITFRILILFFNIENIFTLSNYSDGVGDGSVHPCSSRILHHITQAMEMDKSHALLRSAKLEEWIQLYERFNHSTELKVSAYF